MRPIRSRQANSQSSFRWAATRTGCSRKICQPRIRTLRRIILKHVNPLRLLVDAFVNTFGITQPAPEAAARAGRYIAVMLAAVLVLLGLAAWLLRAAFTH